ncbi:hypothetical protein ATCC90586_010860 [Pythium insidiosum]|nr:hypothetical protein ATCC90586_010860 [Pythium insidiosum]
MDTTMEDVDDSVDVHTPVASSTPSGETHAVGPTSDSNGDDEDVFAFNAPSFYDLRRPEMEKHYVNNADGYFIQHEAAAAAAPSSTWSSTSSPHTIHSPSPTAPDASHSSPANAAPSTPERPARPELSARTPQTPFGGYREPQREQPEEDVDEMEEGEEDEASVTMDLEALEAPREDDCMSDTTLVLETSMDVSALPNSLRPPPRSVRSQGSSASSSGSGSSRLLRPTQSYLRRIEADQAARDRHLAEQVAAATAREPLSSSSSSTATSRSSRLTQPRSPRLRTSRKAHQRHTTEIRLSSTSRELQKIKEERMRVQLETMKIREFHARVRAQRPPANVHQRSTKQLTIPQSPFLAVGHRSSERRFAAQPSTTDDERRPHPYIQPEQLLSRDYELPVAPSHHSHEPTVPQSPQLQTAERAARRTVFADAPETPPPAPDYSKMRVNGVTRALTPQFETDRRAQMAAAYRKPLDVVDKDEEELQRKFHARPVNKKIFEAPSNVKSPVKKMPLTTPKTPGGRLGQPTASYEAAAAEAERLRRELEHQHQQEERQPGVATEPRRPVVPETPPLRSIYRHQIYQENLRRRQEAEEAELRKQREFRAQPIRLISTPPKGASSDGVKRRPLTEVVPFALHTDRVHERAQERLERLKHEEEERLRAAAQFKARPMPSMDETDEGAVMAHHVAPPRAPARPLTKPQPPLLATDRRAAERAAFEAAERDRRARDEAQRKQAEEERRRQEEEEIKRLRREQLVFHARPAPGTSKPFELKPTTRPLTQPESPFLATKARSASAAVNTSSAA